ENIVLSDSENVRPMEEVTDSRQYIQFEDSTYFIKTNCNSISGFYTIKGDSINLGAGMMTRMACENMATEDALCRILPRIVTVDIENDSIARLNSNTDSAYIVLRKATEKIEIE
ncbi:MAG: META domain-containing protein, partial [Prevotella sp.]|nr:META domain-containing protein [Prevotella sp.]